MVVAIVMPMMGAMSNPADSGVALHKAYHLHGSGEAGQHHAMGHLVVQRPSPSGGTNSTASQDPAAAAPQTLAPWRSLLPAAMLLAGMQCSLVLAFTSTFVLINNACRRIDRGTGNGIGQTYASFGRCVGPAVAGSLFAWSQGSGRSWPFDYHFVFYLMVVAGVGIELLSLRLPSKVNRKVYDD